MKDKVKPAIVLLMVCLIASTALASAYSFTAPTIKARKLADKQELMREVFAADGYTLVNGRYVVLKGGNTQGLLLESSTKGYAGSIRVLIGMNNEGRVEGVKILDQDETQGMGNGISQRWFVNQFKGKSLKDHLIVKSDIDAVSGATVSSQAVANAVRSSLKKAEAFNEGERR